MAGDILSAKYWAEWVKNNPEKAAANRAEHYARVSKKHGVKVSMEEYCANLGLLAERHRVIRTKNIDKERCSDEFLSSDEWKSLRLRVLDEYGRVCMCCGSSKSIQVDHIKPRSKYPELALEFGNLQVLCYDCNMRKSTRHERDFRGNNQFALMMI